MASAQSEKASEGWKGHNEHNEIGKRDRWSRPAGQGRAGPQVEFPPGLWVFEGLAQFVRMRARI